MLLASLAALAIDYLIMGVAGNIWVLFAGRVLAGICGATFPTANAYIADLTTAENRASAFGLVGAAFGLGFILGPAFGGLLGAENPRMPFFAAALLAVLNMGYGWWVLPESLAKENRRPLSLVRSNPLGALAHFRKLPRLLPMFLVSLLYSFAHQVYPSIWNFHADARYGWDARQIGWSLMAFGLCSALVQGLLIGKIVSWLGLKRTAIFGLCCDLIGFLGFAFAVEPWMIYAWIPLSALGAVSGPTINSLMTAQVSADAQGELQGAISSVASIANMFGPLLMSQVFYFFITSSTPFYGAAFLLSMLLTVGAAVPLFIDSTSNRQ